MDSVNARMAELVEARRRELRLEPKDLQRMTGLSGQALLNIRKGRVRRYSEGTIHAVGDALQWDADWYDRILEGKAPTPVDADLPASTVTPEMVADLAARFDALLSTAERRTNVVDGLANQWARTAEQTDLLRARVEESTERGVEAIEAMARELVALREKIDRIAAFADWREATLTGAPHDRGGQ